MLHNIMKIHLYQYFFSHQNHDYTFLKGMNEPSSSTGMTSQGLRDFQQIYICPITLELMSNPYSLPCGHTFEHKDILEHLLKNAKKCPLCQRGSRPQDLIPNLNAKQSIEIFKRQQQRRDARRMERERARSEYQAVAPNPVIIDRPVPVGQHNRQENEAALANIVRFQLPNITEEQRARIIYDNEQIKPAQWSFWSLCSLFSKN